MTLITWVPSKACSIVDKYGGFGSCLKCAPGSQFLGEYENDRVIILEYKYNLITFTEEPFVVKVFADFSSTPPHGPSPNWALNVPILLIGSNTFELLLEKILQDNYNYLYHLLLALKRT